MKWIRAAHPKASIMPDPDAIRRICATGWFGQAKVNGRRAQVHVEADGEVVFWTRQATPHTVAVPLELKAAILGLLVPEFGEAVIDAEWHPGTGQLFPFDLLAVKGKALDRMPYATRHALLPEGSGSIVKLPLLNAEQTIALLARDDDLIEGICLKNPAAVGFADTSVVRCRKRQFGT